MNVVIAMAGTGERFIAAGYNQPKPLIEVEAKPIIQHILERFSPEDNFTFICSEKDLGSTALAEVLQKLAAQANLVSIKAHNRGPVYTVLQAEEYIPDSEAVIVNYCDFSWVWDYAKFKQTVSENGCAGCVVAYRGFHPHLLGTNTYASMRDDGHGWMEEIREKYSFSKNKMECFQSSGTYYFKKGADIKKYFARLMQRKIAVRGEYYVSLVYNLMKQDNQRIFIYEIPFFLQWGTPQDLEEYLYWSKYFQARAADED